jgi:hypothetical protein
MADLLAEVLGTQGQRQCSRLTADGGKAPLRYDLQLHGAVLAGWYTDRLPSRGRAASCAPLPILSCKRSMADRLRRRAKNLLASGRHVKTADAG